MGHAQRQTFSSCLRRRHRNDFILRAGATKSFDHCCLINALWFHLAQLKTAVWIERVPTAVNVADDPSRCACDVRVVVSLTSYSMCREQYGILDFLGAERVDAKLSECYLTPNWANSVAENHASRHL